jgi:hypothetical protein
MREKLETERIQPSAIDFTELTNKLRMATFLATILGISCLNADTSVLSGTPPATAAPGGSPHSLKGTVPVESLGDTIVARGNGFEVVPGKDPNGWSFVLEPYLWAMGIDGTFGVKGFDTHVDFSAVNVVKHLDWGGKFLKNRSSLVHEGDSSHIQIPPNTISRSQNWSLPCS